MEFIVTYKKELSFLLQVVIAGVLSAFVGLEREKYKKPAGLRTNMIVGSISCFFVLISRTLIDFIGMSTHIGKITSDPIRIIQAIVVGISFIGAGTILKSNENNVVLYLTTAATLLYSTAIGISVALHQYILAMGLCMFILIINWAINRLERKFKNT